MNPENQKINEEIKNHRHDGFNAQLIDLSYIQGFIRTVDKVPDWTPRNLSEQFAIYNGVTVYRFYWRDTLNNEWRFVAGT